MTWIWTLMAALLPGLWLLRSFYRRDANPEPKGVLVRTALLGALVSIPIVILGILLSIPFENSFHGQPFLRSCFDAFLIAACIEELFKYLVLTRYCVPHPAFDEPMDGIVYGATASLGFACLENVLYVMTGGFEVAIIRALTAMPGHAALGAIMGYYVGKGEFDPAQKARFRRLALGVPILFHGLYNLPLMYLDYAPGISEGTQTLLFLGFLAFLFTEFGIARRHIRELQAQQKLT